MEGVMTQARVNTILARCRAVYAHVQPTYEPIVEDHILQDRMVRHRQYRRSVHGDGNCVVRSIADQLHGDQDRHDEVRKAGVAKLILDRDLYEDYLDPEDQETYDEYVARISCMYVDVDQLLTQAICDAFGVRIIELVSLPDYCIAEFIPENRATTRTIRLVSSLRHTDSMYPL